MKKKLLVVALSLLAALFLAEIVLQVWFSPYVTQIYQLDARLLHRHIPGTQKYFVHHPINGGHRVLVRVNSAGFRGAELGKRREAMRVAVFGDSFIMGEFSELEDTFVEQLERRLAAAIGRPVEAINCGVVAYGPDQTCESMSAELPRLKPDLVVVALFADNDFGDLMRNKMFRLGPDGQLARNGFRISEQLRQKFGEGIGTTALYRWSKRLYRAMRAQHATDTFTDATPEQRRIAAIGEVERWVKGCETEYREYIIDGNQEVRFLFEDHFDSDVCVAPESESAQYKVRLLDAVVERMCDVAASHDTPLAFVVIPSPFELCSPMHGGAVDRTAHPQYVPREMSAKIERAATRRGTPCVNLFDTFTAHDPDSLYFKAPDNHWNAAGQSLAAEVVGDRIIELGLLNARDR